MTRLSLGLLGPFQAAVDGEPLTSFRTKKAQALLIYLAAEDALNPGAPVRRETLLGLLWPDYAEQSARQSMRTNLSYLRRSLSDLEGDDSTDGASWLLADNQTIQINPAVPYELDVARFGRLLAESAGCDHTELAACPDCLERLEEAAALYRGDFLCDFFLSDSAPFEEWAAARRAEFKRQALEALDVLTTAATQANDLESAEKHARQQLASDNLRESAHRQLMRVQALSGHRSQALEQYGLVKQLLHDELGAEPSAETETLYQQLLSGEPLTALRPAEIGERPPRVVGPCPYRGLAAFREEDNRFFFGRDELIDQLVEAVRQRALVQVIVGSSGSGKSSVVYAGLLPRLREDGEWLIAQTRPGSQPFQATAAALLPLLDSELSPADQLIETQKLSRALTEGEVTLESFARQAVKQNGESGRLLLLLDQFEEIYTLCPDDELRRRFLDQLLAAAESSGRQRTPPLVFLLTLRADFMGQALSHRPFADALQDAAFMIGPMNVEELQLAIEKPAELQGAAFEEGLVARILNDVGQEPGHLPLLEFALTLLWEKQEDGWLTHADYEAIGQVEGALARYADQVMDELTQEEQDQARQIFVQLVRPGQGTEDTRRVATRAELGEEHWPLVRHLADCRLVVTGRDEADQETAEVVHEALIQRWGRLQEWMTADRVFRTWQERLRAGLGSWEASDKDEGALLRGGPLAEAEDWLAERGEQMSAVEREYIKASVALRGRQEQEREAQRRRELDAAKQLAETQARAASRIRRSARYLAGALVIAAVLAVFAFLASQQAGRNAETAEANAQEAEANFQLAATREVEAVNQSNERATAQAFAEEQRALAETEAEARATQEAVALSERDRAEDEAQIRSAAQADAEEQRVIAETQRQEALRQASIGLGAQALLELEGDLPERAPLLAIEALENYPYTWQAEQALGRAVYESHLRLILPHELGINMVNWSPDGTRILTASVDDTAKVWDAVTGQEIFTLALEDGFVAWQAYWSPDGDRILVTGRELTVWDATTGELLFSRQAHGDLVYASWSPSGDRIMTTGFGDGVNAKIWDAATGDELLALDGHEGQVRTCGAVGMCTSGYSAWSPSGDRVVTRGVDDGYVIVWDANTGEILHRWTAGPGHAHVVHWSPEGDRILVAGYDGGTVQVWDLVAGQEAMVISDLVGILDAKWSPTGDRFVTAGSAPLKVTVWDSATGKELDSLDDGFYWTATWSPDGDHLALDSVFGETWLWDTSTDAPPQRLGNSGGAPVTDWSPLGHEFATSSYEGVARVWRAASPMMRFEIADGKESIASARWSSHGRQIARAYEDGQIILFDGETGQVELVIQSGHQGSFGLNWSPSDRRLLSVGEDGMAHIWDTQTGELQLSLTGHEGGIFPEAAWSADESQVITSGFDDQTVRIWDTTNGEQLRTLLFAERDDQEVYGPWWSPDGSWLVSVVDGNLGNVKIWDPNSGEILLELYTSSAFAVPWFRCIDWSPDSSRLLIGTADGKLRVWNAITGEQMLTVEKSSFQGGVCEWFPGGDRFLSGDDSAPVRIWDATTGEELLALYLTSEITSQLFPRVTLAPDGRAVAIDNPGGGPMQVLNILQSTEELLQIARECCVVRQLTPDERELFGLPER